MEMEMKMIKNRLVALFVVLAAALMLGGCAATQPKAVTADDLVKNRTAMLTEARAAVPQISIEELKQMIDAKEEFILIDARDPDEWSIGLIDYKNVVTISRGKMEFVAPARYAVNDRIIVYCKTGARSSFTSKALYDLGYTNVTNVTTGMDAWMGAGYPVKDK